MWPRLTRPCSRRAAERRRGPRPAAEGQLVRPRHPATVHCGPRVAAVLLLGVVCGACSSTASNETATSAAPTRNSADSVAVYAAALHAFAERQGPRQVVVQSGLVPVASNAIGPEHPLKSSWPALWQALLAAQSATAGCVPVDAVGPGGVVLWDRELRQLTQSEKGWREFYGCYPEARGLITCSAIGFDSEQRWAMVVVTTGAESPEQSDAFVLEKRDGQWHVSKAYWLLVTIA